MALPFVFDVKRTVEILTGKSQLAKICESKGHVASHNGTIVGRDGTITVYDKCQRCHLPYARTPNLEEKETYERMMKTEFVV